MKHKIFQFLSAFLLIPVLILSGCSRASSSIPAFSEYTDLLFTSGISANTLNLHYTLADPAAYGIEEYPVSLGEFSADSELYTKSSLENMEQMLSLYKKEDLKAEEQLTYDILQDYIDTEMSCTGISLYYEPISPSSGMQTELPILLAEYAFRTNQDISDYLVLLTQVPDYFDSIVRFEKEKLAQGLFMPDTALSTVISWCETFSAAKESNFLVTSFNSRIDQFPGLNDTAKENLKSKNLELILNVVLPAYDSLVNELRQMNPHSDHEGGLCSYPLGTEYYEYLVKTSTGSKDDLSTLAVRIREKRDADLAAISALLLAEPELAAECTSYTLDTSSPEQILSSLSGQITEDFPAPPDTGFTVKYVEESMEPFLSPAFYLTTPIDDTTGNSIYINRGSSYSGIRLFTTLAHEGYPGHLYQNLMSTVYGISPVRRIFSFPGYVEGWATYVEMLSYHYAGLEDSLAELLSLNQSASLSLYASVDLGIHHEGWSLEDTAAFLGNYGITSEETVDEIFHTILYDPAMYLKYYVGYLEFLDLKTCAMQTFNEDYSDRAFHEAVLKMGPAPFDLLEKYLPLYYVK